jgi:hypothetical protein
MGLSVNVIVNNKLGNTDLALLGSGLNHGEWVIGPYGPPKSISANNSASGQRSQMVFGQVRRGEYGSTHTGPAPISLLPPR